MVCKTSLFTDKFKVQVFSSERTVLWGQFKLRNPKITTIFGTNTSCEDPETGLIMESIAAPKSYLVDRLEVVTLQVF